MKVIGFHNPDEENGFLSNWYLSEFSVDGIVFTSMEQFMMYKKAVCFNDSIIAKQILNTQDVACIKKLKDTKDAVLAECAVKDRIWGIGLSMNDPKRVILEQWKGQNLLGYTLMMVRDRM